MPVDDRRLRKLGPVNLVLHEVLLDPGREGGVGDSRGVADARQQQPLGVLQLLEDLEDQLEVGLAWAHVLDLLCVTLTVTFGQHGKTANNCTIRAVCRYGAVYSLPCLI